MPHDLQSVLKQSFGHISFRPGQERVIESLLAGRSALALFPTGAGKSLCYQLPSLLLDGLTVVISRLRHRRRRSCADLVLRPNLAYRVTPCADKDRLGLLTSLLQSRQKERQAFLKKLLRCGKRGTKWTTIDPETAAADMAEPRDRIVKALDWLADSGSIELKPSGSRQRYRLTGGVNPDAAAPPDLDALTRSMQELFAMREARDLKRLQSLLDFAADRSCLTHRLLRYFGEGAGLQASDEGQNRCGRCTSCETTERGSPESSSGATREIPPSTARKITTAQAAAIEALVAEDRPSLRTPRQLARFLCGLTSPATSRERLGRHAAFGLLASVSFATVLAHAESLVGGA